MCWIQEEEVKRLNTPDTPKPLEAKAPTKNQFVEAAHCGMYACLFILWKRLEAWLSFVLRYLRVGQLWTSFHCDFHNNS